MKTPTLSPLIEDLAQRGGSDLHVVAGAPPMVRVKGELVPLRDQAFTDAEAARMLEEVLPARDRARTLDDTGLDFIHEHAQAPGAGGAARTLRLRVSASRGAAGIAMALRPLPPRALALAELGCPEVLWRLADRKAGLVLVSGAAGSGRTTTVGAMIDHVNKTRACNILTIEQPVEILHEPLRSHVTHREIGRDAPSFAAAIAGARREDADVVVVGDLRDARAIRAALELAGSGVLVLATSLATGAAAAVEGLIARLPASEEEEARALLSVTLVGVVTQQLLRTADGSSRVAVFEILLCSAAAGALIRERDTAELGAVMRAGQSAGMQTIEVALERLLTLGRISPEIALEAANDREAISKVVGQIRPDLVLA